jgi:putative endonuclease
MHYVYVIKGTSNPEYYIGYSADLKKRIIDHNMGSNVSTRKGRPWKLVYYESFLQESAARDREKKLKQRGRAWQELQKRIDS